MLPKLLPTKLYIPQYRSNLVPRKRLIEHLDSGLQGKMTLVSAPAGFGKTTLLSEWVQHLDGPVAWLSLDKNDNDLTRFLTYTIAAMQQIVGDIGTDIQAILGESQSPNYEVILANIVNQLEVFPDRFIFILDDFHLIESESVHNALNFLIDYQPLSMHLVISSRSDPLLPISRLRVRGELREVRVRDLRFTTDETAAFLNDLMSCALSPEDIAHLEKRTEGWVASLQLAALSMRGRDDWAEFIAAFSGSHRYVIDYLADEIMSRQTEDVQLFLRRTSILERFCAPLCDAVIQEEINGDSRIIEYLERFNLFLVPLDDHREWYRFHHLFADFLRVHLQKDEPERIPEFHRRASQWFESEGLMDEAIRHALAGRDLERAAHLVESIAGPLVVRRSSKILISWVNQLPPEIFQNFPMLCIWHAWALFFLGQPDSVEPILKIAAANRDKVPGVPIDGYLSTVRGYLANLMGDFHKAIDLSKQALEQMPKESLDKDTLIFRGAAIIWLGVNYHHIGDLDKANDLFIQAAKVNEAARSIYAAVSAKAQSAHLAMVLGQLYKAKEFYQQGFQIAESWAAEQGEGKRTLVAASELHLGLGTILYEWNDLEGATIHIQRAVELLELGGDQGILDGYRLLAYLRHARGDYETAIDLLEKISTVKDKFSLLRNNTFEPHLEQLYILLSNTRPEMSYLLTEVGQRVENLGFPPDEEIDLFYTQYTKERKYADLARALIALGRAAEALPLLRRLQAGAHSMGRHGNEIRYLVLNGLAHHSLGDSPTALISIGQALTLAKPQGYVRLFIDEGIPMAELLQMAISQNIESDYAEQLLAEFPDEIQRNINIRKVEAISQALVEPLSEREIEVLQLMTKGYKYREIAEQMIISVNTVRHHTRNIYSKLNVNNRAQAIARANELNLL